MNKGCPKSPIESRCFIFNSALLESLVMLLKPKYNKLGYVGSTLLRLVGLVSEFILVNVCCILHTKLESFEVVI